MLPALVYVVGRAMFGEYGGTGFSAFYSALHGNLRSGDLATWFLVLSPYLIWQLFRATLLGFKRLGQPHQQVDS